MPCRFLPLLFLLLAGLAGSPAAAQTDNIADCRRPNLPDRRIGACTRVIAGGGDAALMADAYANRGSGWVSKGERSKAEADFNESLKLDSASHVGLATKAALHGLRREWDNAIAAATAAIKLNASYRRAYTIRGNTYMEKRDYDRALVDFEECVRLEPKLALNYLNRGRAHSARRDFDGAFADYDRTVQLDRTYVLAWVYRGYIWRQRGDHDRAIADFTEAIRLEPTRAWSYIDRSNAHAAKSDWTRAIADTEAAIRLDPRNPLARNNRGVYRSKLGNKEEALADYTAAIELNPDVPLYYFNRGALLAQGNEHARALADFTRVLELPALTAVDKQRQDTARERVARLKSTLKSSGAPGTLADVRHKRVALVVGNSAYGKASMLANPVNDARAMAGKLRGTGFTHVVELYDATREQMLEALKTWGDSVEGAEWAVVFFAGHGLELSGTTYVVPVDASLRRDSHVEDEAISLNRIIAKVDAASKIGLVILDSCRDNPFLAKMTRSAGATRSVSQGLAPIEPEGNVLVAYAAKHGTVAEDGTGKHSPFTSALLSHMDERGLEVQFLFRKVRETVRTATSRRQDPFHYGALGAEPLYLKPPLPR